jgi:hypothetical protein
VRTLSRYAFALVLALSVAAPAFAHHPAGYTGPVVLESAHPDPDAGTLTLRGHFGLRPVTVWLGDDRLDLIRQKTDEIVVALPQGIAHGSYELIVARSRLANQYDSMSIALVPYGGGNGNSTPGQRGPAGSAGLAGAAGAVGATGAQGPAGPAGAAGAAGPASPAGPQGPSGLSGYQTVTIRLTVNLAALAGTRTILVNCPSGAGVLSAFIYRVPGGVRHPFPPGVDWAGWPTTNTRSQWTFFLRNANSSGYADPIEAGVVCAITN